MPRLPRNSKSPRNDLWQYAGLATEMLATIGIAVWAGLKLDARTGLSFPLLVIIFPLLALGVILWRIIKATRRNG